ncbi:MAG: nucleotidyltransferase domain-containing protein [Magnetococcales bacterium]|nr:nucleotidyltransferase domain-containing protein [Magnetococcales bacterium]
MISENTIHEAVDRLVKVANPAKVILFGSYATGNATVNSDLDLMVIEPNITELTSENKAVLRNAIGDVGAGVDLLVYTEEEVRRRGQVPGTVIYWALKEGRVMYESSTH